jgi:hypothetical protein
VWLAVQSSHITLPVAQALSLAPLAQVPVVSQQPPKKAQPELHMPVGPVGPVCPASSPASGGALAWHEPDTQICPDRAQFWQAAPPVPHAAGVDDVTHVVPLQHPSAHVCGVHAAEASGYVDASCAGAPELPPVAPLPLPLPPLLPPLDPPLLPLLPPPPLPKPASLRPPASREPSPFEDPASAALPASSPLSKTTGP